MITIFYRPRARTNTSKKRGRILKEKDIQKKKKREEKARKAKERWLLKYEKMSILQKQAARRRWARRWFFKSIKEWSSL